VAGLQFYGLFEEALGVVELAHPHCRNGTLKFLVCGRSHHQMVRGKVRASSAKCREFNTVMDEYSYETAKLEGARRS
jgi:hypothetical protein